MTESARPSPGANISSAPVLRAVLVWGLIVGVAVLLVASVVGYATASVEGLWSAAAGALVGVVFPALTALSIIVANRWYGTAHYLQIFFGIVLGGWLLKFLLVIVALVVLSRVSWIVPLVFYFSLVSAAVASLVVELVVISRMRLPAASDVALPGDQAQGDPGSGNAPQV